jgi:hypothetical protein
MKPMKMIQHFPLKFLFLMELLLQLITSRLILPPKTLGQTTCPTENSAGAISQMKEKAKKWINKAKGGRLHRRNFCFLLDKQFWPEVAFGISSITAIFSELEQCLMLTYYNLLPLGRMRRSVSRELRQLDRGFFGCCLPHPGVECFIAQLKKLLTNYGCTSDLEMHLQTSMELMRVEGGVSMQLLSLLFRCYSKWVTHCWLQSIWEKVDMFDIRVEIKELPLKPPREHNGWIMLLLEEADYLDDKLIHLNRIQCYQQAIFYLDIFDARGRTLDRRYLAKQPPESRWSRLIFPQEKSPIRDFRLWVGALKSIASRGRLQF